MYGEGGGLMSMYGRCVLWGRMSVMYGWRICQCMVGVNDGGTVVWCMCIY